MVRAGNLPAAADELTERSGTHGRSAAGRTGRYRPLARVTCMTETVRQQLGRRLRWITAGFVALMLIGFGVVLLLPGGDPNVFDNPLWVIVIIGALGYIYTMRCRCPRCGRFVAGIYGRIPPRCPWCGLPFDVPWPNGKDQERRQEPR
jgi:hypothetical protein